MDACESAQSLIVKYTIYQFLKSYQPINTQYVQYYIKEYKQQEISLNKR